MTSAMPARRPRRHHAVNPALIVDNVAGLLLFLTRAFGAVEVQRMTHPSGTIVHAEVTIDDSLVMISATRPGAAPMPCSLGLYTDDVDATYRRALAEGARSVAPPADQFYGHRTAHVVDPAGNQWTLHTVVEELSAEELHRRATARVLGRGAQN